MKLLKLNFFDRRIFTNFSMEYQLRTNLLFNVIFLLQKDKNTAETE